MCDGGGVCVSVCVCVCGGGLNRFIWPYLRPDSVVVKVQTLFGMVLLQL